MHPLRSSSKHSIVSLLVRRSRVFRFTSFSKKGTFFRTPWLQRLGLLVFPEDKPHFTTASCFSVAHSAWSFLHTSFLLLPAKKKCQGERSVTAAARSEGWDLMTTEDPPNRGDVPRIAAAGFTTLPHVFHVLVLGSWVSRTGRKKIGQMETAKPNQKDLVFVKELLEEGHAKGKVVITVQQNDNTSL